MSRAKIWRKKAYFLMTTSVLHALYIYNALIQPLRVKMRAKTTAVIIFDNFKGRQ